MHSTLQVIGQILGGAMLISFAAGYAASWRLSGRDESLEEERKEPPGFRWWPKRYPAPKKEDYPEELRHLWVFRDRSLKAFAICAGLLAILAVISVVLDVPFYE
jgi:hypothetical protein